MSWGGIAGFRLVTADPARLVAFYTALGFEPGGDRLIAADEMRLLGLAGTGRRHSLSLGAFPLDLDHFAEPGRPYPRDATAADLVFQHLALVTDDPAAAWARAQAAGARPISTGGPVTLPPASGGVTAIKFRDPDGHPLELLHFPPGSNPAWNDADPASETDGRVLGIDHSAISVADVAASQRFYAGHGLTTGKATLNRGPAQDALDGLTGACADVVPMDPSGEPPHIELLGYRHPAGRPHAPLMANDIAATRIVWHAQTAALVRDPDGHLHQLIPQDRSPADTSLPR